MQYYDSIVWSVEGLPNTVRLYERQDSEDPSEQRFKPTGNTYFFKSGEIKNLMKGYRGGEVVYSTAQSTYLIERDFLCYDWTAGNICIANPTAEGIYNPFSPYQYTALPIQMKNGTEYAKIYAFNKYSIRKPTSWR